MNREIKFRAWNKNLKEIRRVWTISGLDNEDDSEFKYVNGSGWEWKNIILMQFTGLKDKNGKEIYEGDICRNGDYEMDAHAYNYRIEVVEYLSQEGV